LRKVGNVSEAFVEILWVPDADHVPKVPDPDTATPRLLLWPLPYLKFIVTPGTWEYMAPTTVLRWPKVPTFTS